MRASTVYDGWPSRLSRLSRHRRLWIFIGVPLAIILLIAYAVAFVIDEPLRRYTEAKMNRALKGYTVRIKTLDFHPHGFSLDLKGLTVVQDAHPEPPVSDIPYLHASVNWKALLRGRVVGDMLIRRPRVYMNLVQLRKEIADPTPVKERGWQEALEAIYPLKINEFRIREGDTTYQDQGPFKPLRLRNLDFVATNIRNVKSKDRVYPSEFKLEAAVFDSGHVRADGRADFLAEPNPAFMGKATLERIELDYFKPITNRYNVSVDKGLLSATGQFAILFRDHSRLLGELMTSAEVMAETPLGKLLPGQKAAPSREPAALARSTIEGMRDRGSSWSRGSGTCLARLRPRRSRSRNDTRGHRRDDNGSIRAGSAGGRARGLVLG